jgi:hypothetical protein
VGSNPKIRPISRFPSPACAAQLSVCTDMWAPPVSHTRARLAQRHRLVGPALQNQSVCTPFLARWQPGPFLATSPTPAAQPYVFSLSIAAVGPAGQQCLRARSAMTGSLTMRIVASAGCGVLVQIPPFFPQCRPWPVKGAPWIYGSMRRLHPSPSHRNERASIPWPPRRPSGNLAN